MPDYYSTGLWNESGKMISFSSLDIKDDILIRKLILWVYNWENFDSNTPNNLELRNSLEQEGLSIARNLLHYFPDYSVLYQFENEVILITSALSVWTLI